MIVNGRLTRGFPPWLSRAVTSSHPRWRLGSCDGHWPSCPHVVWGPCGWRGHGRRSMRPSCRVSRCYSRCGDLPVVARATRVTRLWRVTTWVGYVMRFRWCLTCGGWRWFGFLWLSPSWLCGCCRLPSLRGLFLVVEVPCVARWWRGLSVMGSCLDFGGEPQVDGRCG